MPRSPESGLAAGDRNRGRRPGRSCLRGKLRVRAADGEQGCRWSSRRQACTPARSLSSIRDNYVFSVSHVSRRGTASQSPHQLVWQGGFGDQSIPPDPAHEQASLLRHRIDSSTESGLMGIDDPQDVTASRCGRRRPVFPCDVPAADSAARSRSASPTTPGRTEQPLATVQYGGAGPGDRADAGLYRTEAWRAG